MKRIFSYLIIGLMFLVFTACDTIISPKLITIVGKSELFIGESEIYSLSFSPKNADISVSWVLNKDIASIDQTGYLVAISIGEVEIMVTSTVNSNITAKKIIKIVEEEKIYSNSVQIIGTGRMSVGDSYLYSYLTQPINSERDFKWYTTNEDVAIVNEYGIVFALKEGVFDLIVESLFDDSVKNVKTITITNDNSVELVSPIEISIVGRSVIFVKEVVLYSIITLPSKAIDDCVFIIDDEEVATITENGVLTALKAGVVKLTAISKEDINVFDELIIDIIETSTSLVVSPDVIRIIGKTIVEKGEVLLYSIAISPLIASKDVFFSSSDESLLTIDSNGIAKALNTGVVSLRAVSILDEEVFDDFIISIVEPSTYLDLQNIIKNVISDVKDSVIGITNYKYDPKTGKNEPYSLGSAAIYRIEVMLKNGTLMDYNDMIDKSNVDFYRYWCFTNRHVIDEATMLRVYLHSIDLEVEASLKGADDKVDLAIVTFDYTTYYKSLVLADSSLLEIGDFVLAIGNPYSYNHSTSVTFGIVSYPSRFISVDTDNDGINDWDNEYIQTDAALNPGNSGGPLFNLSGEIIGVNTMKYMIQGSSIDMKVYEGMGFAIPTNVVKDLIPYLEIGIIPTRARLGITSQEVRTLLNANQVVEGLIDGINYGIIVTAISPDSVAEAGGVRVGDIILEFNGVKLIKTIDVRKELGKMFVGSGQNATLLVIRDSAYINLTLEF